MGAEWDRDKGGRLQWVEWLTGILSDARRATRDGGRAIVWSLPRTSHWTGCAVEDAGWSIETTIAHLFGTGWPKGKAQTKPAQETWWLARTGKSEALNIEACRVTSGGPSPSIRCRETAARTGVTPSGKTGPTGWENRNSPEHYTAPREGELAGRYPPNLLLSHVEGCVCEGTRQAPRNIVRGNFNPSKRARNAYGIGVGQSTDTIAESVEAWACVEGCPVAELDAQSGESASHGGGRSTTPHLGGGARPSQPIPRGDTGTASRYFPQFPADDPDAPWSAALFRYVAKPSRAERNAGCDGMPEQLSNATGFDGASVAHRIGSDGKVTPKAIRGPAANHHPTVKSVALMRWLLRLVTKPGDVVLDPFGGSGTTGVAALLEGRRVILVEREPQYAAIARARCAAAEASIALASQPALFATP
jgi:site-specific DNA-methyltransferase (adenine-specific)